MSAGRRWTTVEKLRIVEESLTAGSSVIEVARRHDVHPNLLHLWRRQARTGVLSVTQAPTACFVPVTVAAESDLAGATGDEGAGSAVEVVLRNGRVLRLSERAAPGRVAQLADALEGYLR